MNNTIAMAVFAVFIIILLGIIVFLAMKLRSGKKEVAYSSENLDDDFFNTEDDVQQVAELRPEKTSITTDDSDNSTLSLVAQLLSEGHETKAIAMLNTAIANQPNHSKFHMMLLNIYAKNNDTANFEKIVDDLHLYGDVTAIAKANEIRNQLQPINTELDIDELRSKSTPPQPPVTPTTEHDDLAFSNELDDIFNDSLNANVSDLNLNKDIAVNNSVLNTLNENTANNFEVTSGTPEPSNDNEDFLALDSALNDELSISQQLSAIESTIVNSKALSQSMLDEADSDTNISNNIQNQPIAANSSEAKSEDDFFSLDFEDSTASKPDISPAQPNSEIDSINFLYDANNTESHNPVVSTTNNKAQSENSLDFSFDIDNKEPSRPVVSEQSLSLESTDPKTDDALSFDFDSQSVSKNDDLALSNNSSDDFSSLELSLNAEVDKPLSHAIKNPTENSVENNADAGFDFELSIESEPSNLGSNIAENSIELNQEKPIEQSSIMQSSQDKNSINFNLDELSSAIPSNDTSLKATTSANSDNGIDLDFGTELDALSLDSPAVTTQNQKISSTESLVADFDAGLDIQLTDSEPHQLASTQPTPKNIDNGSELVQELSLEGAANNTKDASLELEAFSLVDSKAVTDDLTNAVIDKPIPSESIELNEFSFDSDLGIENKDISINIEPEAQNPGLGNVSQKDTAIIDTNAVQTTSNDELVFDIEPPDQGETAHTETPALATIEPSVDFSFDDDSVTNSLENSNIEQIIIEKPAIEEPALDIQTPVAATAEDSALLSKIKTEFSLLDSVDTSQTNLELASSYVKLGEYSGAKALLTEVISSGNSDQQAKANDLLSKLSA